MWFRCGIDEWHLDCLIGGKINLKEGSVSVKGHDFIASIRRKGRRLVLTIPPSYTKIFESNEELNRYLKALGLEELTLPTL